MKKFALNLLSEQVFLLKAIAKAFMLVIPIAAIIAFIFYVVFHVIAGVL